MAIAAEHHTPVRSFELRPARPRWITGHFHGGRKLFSGPMNPPSGSMTLPFDAFTRRVIVQHDPFVEYNEDDMSWAVPSGRASWGEVPILPGEAFGIGRFSGSLCSGVAQVIEMNGCPGGLLQVKFEFTVGD